MKYFTIILSIILFVSCHSRLENPENLPLMMDNSANENLKITVNAFMNNPFNKDFLENKCTKSSQNRKFCFIYSKDDSFIQTAYDIPTEVHIISGGKFFNYGIEIGQTRAEFESIFYDLESKEKLPYINNKRDKIEFSTEIIGKSIWHFYFENGTLKIVDFIKT
jgi:hypothetical protein